MLHLPFSDHDGSAFPYVEAGICECVRVVDGIVEIVYCNLLRSGKELGAESQKEKAETTFLHKTQPSSTIFGLAFRLDIEML